MDIKRAGARMLLGLGLLLAAPGLAACGGDPDTGQVGDGSVGSDTGGGGPTLEATGMAEDTGDRAGHGSGEGAAGSGEGEPSSGESTG